MYEVTDTEFDRQMAITERVMVKDRAILNKLPDITDERLVSMLEALSAFPPAFDRICDDLRLALTELQRYRARPLHCPCCDGDHL